MTVDRAPGAAVTQRSDLILDGLFTGMIGALVVAVWFLILDTLQGRAFYTPALLGTVMLHGGEVAANGPVIAPLEIAAYTAFHFVMFIAVGFLLSYFMNLFEKFPIMFYVLLVLFLALQFGFFGLNLALGAQLLGQLPAWTVVTANLLAASAMAFYQWKRHPRVMRNVDKLWQDDPAT